MSAMNRIKFSAAFLLDEDTNNNHETIGESEDGSIGGPEEDVLPTQSYNQRKYLPVPLPNQLLSNEIFTKFTALLSQQSFNLTNNMPNSNVNLMTNLILQQYLQRLNLRSQEISSPRSDMMKCPTEMMREGLSDGEVSQASPLKSKKAHAKLPASSVTPSTGERQPYTETELSAAVRAICFGRLGTRRAASVYGIPRSTLRNKICKLNELKKREEERIGNGPISMSDFLMYLNKIDSNRDGDSTNSANNNSTVSSGIKGTSQIASRIASVFQVNCRRSNVLRTRQVTMRKAMINSDDVNPRLPSNDPLQQQQNLLLEEMSQLTKGQNSGKLTASNKRKYNRTEVSQQNLQMQAWSNNCERKKFGRSDIINKCIGDEKESALPKLQMVMEKMRNLSEFINTNNNLINNDTFIDSNSS